MRRLAVLVAALAAFFGLAAPPAWAVPSVQVEPSTWIENFSITYIAEVTNASGNIVSVQFDFNDDGIFEYPPDTTYPYTADFNFPDNGPKAVGIRVVDGAGTHNLDDTVTVINRAPGILLTINVGAEGTPTTFSCVCSDTAADTLSYSWAFGDGGTSTSNPTSRSYADNGTFTATLTVSDEDGGTNTATATIVIPNANPVVNAGADKSVSEGDPVAFSDNTATDVPADPLTYSWAFGDTFTDTALHPTHTYATLTPVIDAGGPYGVPDNTPLTLIAAVSEPARTYTATFSANDGDGGTASDTVNVTVNPDGSATLDYAWDIDNDGVFDDGTAPTATFPATATHGAYTVRVRVTDDDGNTTTDSDTVQVGLPPTLSITAVPEGPGVVPNRVEFEATTSDPDGDPVTVSWTFGDGGTATGPSVRHTYTATGTYVARATATDGQETSFREIVIVIGTPPNAFSDIAGSYGREQINALAALGITSGCAAGLFCPGATVTRGEMAVFLSEVLDLEPGAANVFTDDAGHFAEADINSIASIGITAGCAAGRYCPNNPVTREEMAVFLMRTYTVLHGAPFDGPLGGQNFSDIGNSFAQTQIRQLSTLGVTTGTTTSTFSPTAPVTREAMAVFLIRLMTVA